MKKEKKKKRERERENDIFTPTTKNAVTFYHQTSCPQMCESVR